MDELLSQGGKLDGIFAMNDMMAIGALSSLHRAGLRIPRDLSLIGYDNIEFGQFTVPPLTSISQDGAQTGKLAVDNLLRLVNGQTLGLDELLVEPRIVERESTR